MRRGCWMPGLRPGGYAALTKTPPPAVGPRLSRSVRPHTVRRARAEHRDPDSAAPTRRASASVRRRSPPSSRTSAPSSRCARCWSGSSTGRSRCSGATPGRSAWSTRWPASYRKEADIGVACQSGRVFPLTRGRDRRGGRAARLGDLRRLRARCPAGTCPRPTGRRCAAVIGVPIWWRTEHHRLLRRSSAATPSAPSASEDAGLLELFAKHAALAITYARLHESRRGQRPRRGGRRGAQPHGPRGPRHRGQGPRLGAPAAALGRGGPRGRARRRARGRHRRGPRRGPLRARGDPAQRAGARALAARGPLAGGGPRAGAGLGQPHRRRPTSAWWWPASRPRCAPRWPTRSSGSPRRR